MTTNLVTSSDVRKRYLDFFAEKEHAVIPSSKLVPENDPTTLFTGSGMQQLMPYLLGEDHPKGTRLTDSQKCFRAEDIDEVGDNRHTTFFEMLGNWSLGDYFKQEQLPWFFEFLTKEMGIDPQNLYVTVFDGAPEIDVPRDEESIEVWQRLFKEASISHGFQEIGSEEDGYKKGMQEGARIFSYDAKQNWWSRAGIPDNMPEGEPGGPDSEVFYDFGTKHDSSFGEHCHPSCDCGRFLEIGNSVFMEYVKTADGFEKLQQQNVDFGGGLERIVAAVSGSPDVFTIDTLGAVISQLEDLSGKLYADNKAAFRIVADHVRGAVFMIGDGVLPSNTEQGYFVRRLLRRSVRYADQIGIPVGSLQELALSVVTSYKDHYDELSENESFIKETIGKEEEKFRTTLEKGMKRFEKVVAAGAVSGEQAATLFTTYGFPIELTQELAEEKGVAVDLKGFQEEMKKHQELSRAGAEQKFKGGLADHSNKTTQLHTTHHLLLKALQIVLGDHVKQRGSNITSERLRIDFLHDEKLTDEQRTEVEQIVNEKIKEKLPMIRTTMSKEAAEKLGAEMEFGQKYPDTVSVYSIGPKEATEENPMHTDSFSIEFCGGPHVSNTGDIEGTFKIAKEKASAAGIRRIRGLLVLE